MERGMQFATWEQGLVVVLGALTTGSLIKGLTPTIKTIRAGKADRERTDRVGERVQRVIREVLFQQKVMGGRPVAGTMHALVFFGFLCFGIETIEHFLKPFGFGVQSLLMGSAKPYFHIFLSGVATVTAAAITGLFIRRFFMPKYSPDTKSYSSGFVALLIFMLMATYLYSRFPQAPHQHLNWWIHALCILIFPPLILGSKHFHLMIGPLNIFFRTFRMGQYLPLDLNFDEDEEEEEEEDEDEMVFGITTIKEAPWKMRMDFYSCVECRRCTDQCPANNCGQDLDPRAFIMAGRKALTDEGNEFIGSVISETALGQCTSCGACENICPMGIEHLSVLNGAKRAQALDSGQGMVASEFLGAVENFGNPFKQPQSTRKNLLKELEIPLFEEGKTEYLLWLGCVWSFNEDAKAPLASMVNLLKRAGVSYGVLEEESCCGHHSRRQGEEMQFQTQAEENIERLQEAKVTKVVTPCPHCLHTIGKEFPEFKEEFAVEIEHHSVLLARLVQEGKLEVSGRRLEKKITYHDPCYLGRYEHVFEAPRAAIAQAGYNLTELDRSWEKSFCCGGGSAGFLNPKEEKYRVDQERSKEITDSGAEILVTSCPECKMMLGTAASEKTMDLAELLDEATRSAEAEAPENAANA
jgi:Fe-S oxidoreductase